MKRLVPVLGFVLCLALVGAAEAAPVTRVVHGGLDGWSTPGDGSTFTDFSHAPIPAGFFCVSSAPFAGRIEYKGAPIAADHGKTLGNADTLVERLDDAYFDKRGIASSRIQIRALQLVSTKPVKTSCGDFNAKVVLHGNQPTTRMKIVRETAEGGFYIADLSVNTKILFTPVGKPNAVPLVLQQNVRFNRNPRTPWSAKWPGGQEVASVVRVDTDGDGRVDSVLPGFSNFVAGLAADQRQGNVRGGSYICHANFDDETGTNKQHCIYLCDGCQIP